MNSIKLFSFLEIAVIVTAISLYSNMNQVNKTSGGSRVPMAEIKETLNKMKELNLQNPPEVISKKEYSFELSKLESQLNTYWQTGDVNKTTDNSDPLAEKAFWIKVIFSSIFSLAALFVVLSKKYDEDTKKWAFSILSLIAGVWIGTVI